MSKTKKNRSKQPPRNHVVDYFVTMCVVCLLVIILGFWYVEDIRVGISVIAERFMQEFFPEALP
jgi:hypothetical protein